MRYLLLMLISLSYCTLSVVGLEKSAVGQEKPDGKQTDEQVQEKIHEVKDSKLGETKNVHQCGNLFLAGQFSKSDIVEFTKNEVKRVISLRTEGEIDWDEKGALEDAEIEFVVVPFRSPESLTDEVFDEVRELLSDKKTVTVFHCGSANRVGGVWLPFRVLDEGIELEKALEEAKQIGLRNAQYEAKALDYIKRKQEQK